MVADSDSLPDDDDYVLNPDDLHGEDETLRRFAVISISKGRLKEYEPVLLGMLSSEPAEDNRRHASFESLVCKTLLLEV
jgi:hypothetical protein